MTSRHRDSPAAFTALSAAGIIWGSSFVVGKIALRELDVAHMILYRFLFASVAFLPMLVRSRPRFSLREWGAIVAVAIIGVPVQFLMQFEGLSRTTASHASLMIGTAPVLVAVGAFLVFRERLRITAWLALLASTAGVVLIVSGGGAAAANVAQPSLWGDMLVLFSMVSATVWVLASKQLMVRHSPAVVSGVIIVMGTIALTGWVIARDGLPTTDLHNSTWIAVLVLGVIATTCATLLWNWGLSHTDAGRAGAFINLEPVVGAALGVGLLHESLGPWSILGGLLIVAGALVVSFATTEKGQDNRTTPAAARSS